MLVEFLQGGEGAGNYCYPIMIQMIFVFPVIYFLVKKERIRGLIICFVINVVYEILKTAYEFSDESYRLLIFRYIFIIAFGCYIYLYDFSINIKLILATIVCSLIGIIYLIAVSYCGYNPIIFTNWSDTCCIAVLYICPIGYFLIKKGNMKCRLLETIGKASYNVFLVQMLYFRYLSSMVYDYSNHNGALAFLVTLLICLSGGIIFYYLEMPITRKITNILFRHFVDA